MQYIFSGLLKGERVYVLSTDLGGFITSEPESDIWAQDEEDNLLTCRKCDVMWDDCEKLEKRK